VVRVRPVLATAFVGTLAQVSDFALALSHGDLDTTVAQARRPRVTPAM
jgi:hypothetical protein